MITIRSKDLLKRHLPSDTLEKFLGEAEAANRRFNLFSRNLHRPDLRVLVAESLLPLELGWLSDGSGSALDIGSGWGIPAIPLLLALPELNFTMVERSGKKAGFLSLALHRLGVKGTVFHGDLKEYPGGPSFRTITLRQVSVSSPLHNEIRRRSVPEGVIIHFGGTLDETLFASPEVVTYIIDDFPPRRLVRAAIF